MGRRVPFQAPFFIKPDNVTKRLRFSIGGISETYNCGLFLNGLSGFCYKVKGVQISGLINNIQALEGIFIAALGNVTTNARGLQIGLINKCKTGNVVQIGLFNRIGKRVIPFVNFQFKKEK